MSDIIEFPRKGVRARRYQPPVIALPMDTSSRLDVGAKLRVDIQPASTTLAEHAALQSAIIIRLTPPKSPQE